MTELRNNGGLKKVLLKLYKIRRKARLQILFPTKLLTGGLQFYSKETPVEVFSCEFYKNLKNTNFGEHIRTVVFVSHSQQILKLSLGYFYLMNAFILSFFHTSLYCFFTFIIHRKS